MNDLYSQFCDALNILLRPTLDKNVIIYGCNDGGDFIRWYYKTYFDKEVKGFVDRWSLSPNTTVPHLWSLYYIYEENDVIVNTTFRNIKEEFNDTGEQWSRICYHDSQILELWNALYDINSTDKNDDLKPNTTYYDWLEFTFKIDLIKTIRRKNVRGIHSHGYFPTDFRMILDAVAEGFCDPEKDAILDIGCGKGSGILSLRAAGFKHIGAIEYTDKIYRTMLQNLDTLKLSYTEHSLCGEEGRYAGNRDGGIYCYLGDASLMERQLDIYNCFFLFNPFSWEIMEKVFKNICSSMERKPRKVFLFYAEPIAHRLIVNSGRFVVRKRLCDDYSGVSYYCYIYESVEQNKEVAI